MADKWGKYAVEDAPTDKWDKYAVADRPSGNDAPSPAKITGPMTAPPPTPVEGSGFGRLLHGAWDTAAGVVGGAGQAIKAMASGNPYDQMQFGAGVVQGSVDQAKKAKESWDKGQKTEAFGHALGAMPLIGPAAAHAGERAGGTETTFDKYGNVVEQGKGPDVWGGVGEGGALVAMSSPENVVKPAVKLGARGLTAAGVPERLNNAAETQYNQVLGATKRPMKTASARVVGGYDAPAPELGEGKTVAVPGLIERGVTAMTRKGLAKKLNAAVSATGDQLDAAWDALPDGAAVPAEKVYAAIDGNLKSEFTINNPNGGSAPTGPDGARGLEFGRSLIDYLKSHEVKQPDGTMGLQYDSLRQFRQSWDDLVAKADGFGNDLTGKVTAAAYRASADGIRNIINGDNPNVAAINREFSFWKQAADVMNETNVRTTGQAKPLGRKMARAGAQAAGLVHGGPAAAVIAGEAMDAVEGVITSPGWKTISAVIKNRLADAITSQNPKQIAVAVSAAQQALPKQPLDSPASPDDIDGLASEFQKRRVRFPDLRGPGQVR